MKLAGAHGSIALAPRRNSRATWPGLLSPHGDHTCGWTTSTLHSHGAWRYWFRWGCGTSSTSSFIADLAGGHIPYPRSTSPDHSALHPLRRDAPGPSRRTRYVAMHPIRRGVMPTDRVHRLPQQAQLRAIALRSHTPRLFHEGHARWTLRSLLCVGGCAMCTRTGSWDTPWASSTTRALVHSTRHGHHHPWHLPHWGRVAC